MQAEIGAVLQPAQDRTEPTILVGSTMKHETTVNGGPAHWYTGAWAASGQWIDDETWLSLIWQQDDMVYHLSGQNLPLHELVQIAESLP